MEHLYWDFAGTVWDELGDEIGIWMMGVGEVCASRIRTTDRDCSSLSCSEELL
jgi:hypothetical protein